MDEWNFLSLENAPTGLQGRSGIWTGQEAIFWGGRTRTSELTNTGARYDPVLDTWTPMSLLNAPSPRANHAAVWTGSEMIIWGGYTDTWVNDGYKYNPSSDTWTTISLLGGPSARSQPVVVWTGSEMLVWGGSTSDGARYNPSSDTWKTMNPIGGIIVLDSAAHTRTSAVWTGNEMVISYGNILFFYDPDSDSWRNRVGLQSTGGTDYPIFQSLIQAGDFLITEGSIFDLVQDKVVAEFPFQGWSFLEWTGSDLLLLEIPVVPGMHPNITGMRHTIDLIFPYQKD